MYFTTVYLNQATRVQYHLICSLISNIIHHKVRDHLLELNYSLEANHNEELWLISFSSIEFLQFRQLFCIRLKIITFYLLQLLLKVQIIYVLKIYYY